MAPNRPAAHAAVSSALGNATADTEIPAGSPAAADHTQGWHPASLGRTGPDAPGCRGRSSQSGRDRGGHFPRVFRLVTGVRRAARTGYDPLFACPGMMEKRLLPLPEVQADRSGSHHNIRPAVRDGGLLR